MQTKYVCKCHFERALKCCQAVARLMPTLSSTLISTSATSFDRTLMNCSEWLLVLKRPWEMIFSFSISSRNMRLNKEILILVYKHKIEKKIPVLAPENEISIQIYKKGNCMILRKIKKVTAFFGKYQSRFSQILTRIVLISMLVLVPKSKIHDNKSKFCLDASVWRNFFSLTSESSMFQVRVSDPKADGLFKFTD